MFRIILIIWLLISIVRFLVAVISGFRAARIEQKAEDAGLPLDQDTVGFFRMMNSKAFAWSLISIIVTTIILLVTR